MSGSIGTKIKKDYEWAILFDQTFIMYMDYKKQSNYTVKLEKAWNKNKADNQETYSI